MRCFARPALLGSPAAVASSLSRCTEAKPVQCIHGEASVAAKAARQLILPPTTSFLTGSVGAQAIRSAGERRVGTRRHCRRKANDGVRALFTGIVEEMGTVKSLTEVDGGWELVVQASTVLEDVKLGDSIAVNGTCLTVTEFDSSQFKVGLAPETLRKTSLEELKAGSNVNLERSLTPNGRMGGHFVQGHVDGTGVITRFQPEGDSLWVTVKANPQLLRYIVPKGYIAVDGTSLTVVDVIDSESSFTFMLVAYTQQKIVVAKKKVGDKVNLEVDIVGKYVERMMAGYQAKAKDAPASDVYNPFANVDTSTQDPGTSDSGVVLTAGVPTREHAAGPSGYGSI